MTQRSILGLAVFALCLAPDVRAQEVAHWPDPRAPSGRVDSSPR